MYRFYIAAFLLFASHAAFAVCPINPAHYRVGADATYCTHNTIQAAIDAVGSCPVVIDVTREHLYGSGGFCTPSQSGGCHLQVGGKSVTLQGWGDGTSCYTLTQNICPTCPPNSTVPLVTLDGASGGGPVLSVSGHSDVSLRNLTMTHGNAENLAQSGTGGGIYFDGYGSLTLDNSTVDFNNADHGGGIDVNGSGGTALLTLNANTLVLSNNALDGGGIRLTNSAHLVANQAATLIAYNQANGAGGGIAIYGPAIADVGSPGYGNFGVIYDNQAVLGGGVAAYAGTNNDTDEGRANFYTTDPQHPVTIEQNFASSQGGAIYAKGFSSYLPPGIVTASACLANYRILGNAAPDGAIAYLDWDTSIDEVDYGSRLYLSTGGCGPGVACAAGVGCNQAYDNVSQNGSAQTTNGAAIVVGTSSLFQAGKLDLRGSTGDYLIRIVGNNDYAYPVQLSSCVIADNPIGKAIDVVEGNNVEVDIDNCTVTNNSGGLGADNLTNSLFFEPGYTVGALNATYVLANDISGLPSGATVQLLSDPKFADAANGDYHLRIDSPAVDYAGGLGGTDLDGYPRDVDLAAHPNAFGPRDLGAYERQSDYACDDAPDALFCSSYDSP